MEKRSGAAFTVFFNGHNLARRASFIGTKFGGGGKARAGKNSFPPTPFLFARPSVRFRSCRAKRGNQSGFRSKKVRAFSNKGHQTGLRDFLRGEAIPCSPRGAVNSEQVTTGAVIIHFARTFFERKLNE